MVKGSVAPSLPRRRVIREPLSEAIREAPAYRPGDGLAPCDGAHEKRPFAPAAGMRTQAAMLILFSLKEQESCWRCEAARAGSEEPIRQSIPIRTRRAPKKRHGRVPGTDFLRALARRSSLITQAQPSRRARYHRRCYTTNKTRHDRFRVQSGRFMLLPRNSANDPKRTFRNRYLLTSKCRRLILRKPNRYCAALRNGLSRRSSATRACV